MGGRSSHAGTDGVHDALVFGIVGNEGGDESAVVGDSFTTLTYTIEDDSDQLCSQTVAAELGLDDCVADDDATADAPVMHGADDLAVDHSLIATSLSL